MSFVASCSAGKNHTILHIHLLQAKMYNVVEWCSLNTEEQTLVNKVLPK